MQPLWKKRCGVWKELIDSGVILPVQNSFIPHVETESEYLLRVTRNCWSGIKQRCTNKNNPCYYRYGGRGITYDPKWETFEGFVADMGIKPLDELTIERIDNDGNYCKENCKWATRIEQAANKRPTEKTLLDYCEYQLAKEPTWK